MKLAIANDHRGYDLKKYIMKHLKGVEIIDLGSDNAKSDYSKQGIKLGEYVVNRNATAKYRGLLDEINSYNNPGPVQTPPAQSTFQQGGEIAVPKYGNGGVVNNSTLNTTVGVDVSVSGGTERDVIADAFRNPKFTEGLEAYVKDFLNRDANMREGRRAYNSIN